MNYVATKVTKRMDSYRVRKCSKENDRNILLPISYGVSSLTLLHILDQQIHKQLERTGRGGFTLHVLYIDHSVVGETKITSEPLGQKYPLHTYHESMIEDVFTLDAPISREDLASAGLSSDLIKQSSTLRPAERLNNLLSALSSPSSRADIINLLRTRLVTAKAKALGCEAVVWGNSTTRLAEITLAETAKGRGYSLPLQTKDGPSPLGTSFLFPMRDLLRKEISTYSQLTSPPLTLLLGPTLSELRVGTSIKDTTIDELMAQYFASVEESYPNIVANVVRTCNKLTSLTMSDKAVRCEICKMPIDEGKAGLFGWGGDTSDLVSTSKNICYGCARSYQESTTSSSFP